MLNGWVVTTIFLVIVVATCKVHGKFAQDSECGTSVGCLYDCSDGADCTFLISWKDKGDGSIDFTIKAVLSPGERKWFAIGFSHDKLMNADSVTECIMENNGNAIDSVGVYHSYNDDDQKYNYRLDQGVATIGLELLSATTNDGAFICQFNQVKAPGNVPNQVYDLTKTYYMLYAHGKVDSTDPALKQMHSLNPKPLSSSVKLDFQMTGSYRGREEGDNTVKIHGCLMVLAWVFFASIGVVIARYYKTMWPDDWWCGHKIWFQTHRIIMMFTLCSCAAGFILIFVKEKEWVTIEGTNFQKAHPYIGTAVMALALLNPIMAVFRCHPDDSRRKYFNWAHWFVGIVAHILGILTIFIGLSLEETGVPVYVIYIMIAYVVYQFLFELFLEIHQCCLDSRNRGEDYRPEYEMKNRGDSQFPDYRSEREESRESRVKKAALALHVLVITGFTVAICVLLFIH